MPHSRPKAAHEANKGRGRQEEKEERRNGRFYYHYSQRLGTSAARPRQRMLFQREPSYERERERMPPPNKARKCGQFLSHLSPLSIQSGSLKKFGLPTVGWALAILARIAFFPRLLVSSLLLLFRLDGLSGPSLLTRREF